MIDLTKDDGDDNDDNDDVINDYDDDVDAIDIVGVAQQKWLRHLEELDGYIPVTHDDDNDAITVAEKKWIRQKEEEDIYTPPFPHEEAVVIQEPASTGQPPPLPQESAAVIQEPASTGQPPLIPRRRAGGRQQVPDHTGKPCGCGCGKKLEHKAYKPCHKCEGKYPSIASNKIRLPCWGKGKHCIACSDSVTVDAERYNSLIAPAFFNGYKKI